jgi:hypothetical protein
MTLGQFIQKHKKEMIWGAGFGVIMVFLSDAFTKILQFISMVGDWLLEALIFIIQLPLKIVTILHLSDNTFMLVIAGAIVGSLLGIVVKPVIDWIFKAIRKLPV